MVYKSLSAVYDFEWFWQKLYKYCYKCSCIMISNYHKYVVHIIYQFWCLRNCEHKYLMISFRNLVTMLAYDCFLFVLSLSPIFPIYRLVLWNVLVQSLDRFMSCSHVQCRVSFRCMLLCLCSHTSCAADQPWAVVTEPHCSHTQPWSLGHEREAVPHRRGDQDVGHRLLRHTETVQRRDPQVRRHGILAVNTGLCPG